MTLPWKTESDRSISIIEDGISGLLHHYCEGMLQERQACRLDVEKQYHHKDVFSGQVDLAYDITPQSIVWP